MEHRWKLPNIVSLKRKENHKEPMQQIQQKHDHFPNMELFLSPLPKPNQRPQCSEGGARPTDVLHVFRLQFPRVTRKGVARKVVPCWVHMWARSCLGDRLGGAQQASLAANQGPAGSPALPQTLPGKGPTPPPHWTTGPRFLSHTDLLNDKGRVSSYQGARVLVLHQMFKHCH